MRFDAYPLDESERAAIAALLARVPAESIDLATMWRLLDQVWEEMGCDNRHPDPTLLAAYYRHPVWVLNGLFIEQDQESLANRQIVVDFASRRGFHQILDYGGGFGTLARLLARANPRAHVDVYEPHPSRYALALAESFDNVRYVETSTGTYDCVVSLDVLEHTERPLSVLAAMIERTRDEGYLVIGNCFEPVIKCHLPSTFHLRRSFTLVARMMGLQPTDECAEGYPQAFIKGKSAKLNGHALRVLETASRVLSPLLETRLSVIARRVVAAAGKRSRQRHAQAAADSTRATRP